MGGVSAGVTPSTIVPPPVNDTGSVGTSPAYALADHTHVSSVYAMIRATTDATGIVSWAYPEGFFKSAPVLALTVEDTSANAMDAKLTATSAAGGTARIIASSALPGPAVSLLGLNVFGGIVPVGTRLHIIARRMTGT